MDVNYQGNAGAVVEARVVVHGRTDYEPKDGIYLSPSSDKPVERLSKQWIPAKNMPV